MSYFVAANCKISKNQKQNSEGTLCCCVCVLILSAVEVNEIRNRKKEESMEVGSVRESRVADENLMMGILREKRWWDTETELKTSDTEK
jgi:hypothetical protein